MHAPLSCYQLTPQLRYLYIIISSGMQPAALCYTVMLCITSCGVKVCGLPRCRVSSLSPAALSYIISCRVQVCGLLQAPLSCYQLTPSCAILYNQLWCGASCAILYNQLWCAGVWPAPRPSLSGEQGGLCDGGGHPRPTCHHRLEPPPVSSYSKIFV